METISNSPSNHSSSDDDASKSPFSSSVSDTTNWSVSESEYSSESDAAENHLDDYGNEKTRRNYVLAPSPTKSSSDKRVAHLVKVALKKASNRLDMKMKKILKRLRSKESAAKKGKIPDVFVYDGRDTKRCDEFLTQCDIFFRNTSGYKRDSNRIWYAVARLKDLAYEWVSPLIHSDSLPASWLEFRSSFKGTFGAHDATQQASQRLLALKQGSRPASKLLTEFHSLRSHVTWNDSALIAVLYTALRSEVKDEFAKMDLPDDLESYCILIVKTDNRLFRRSKEKEAEIGSRLNIRERDQPVGSTSGSKPKSGFTPKPKFTPRFADKLTESEKDRRKRLGLCTYCGSADHQLSDCSDLIKKEKSKGKDRRYSISSSESTNEHEDRTKADVDGKEESFDKSSEDSTLSSLGNGRVPHFLLNIQLRDSSSSDEDPKYLNSVAMLDSGATGNFISKKLVETMKFDTVRKSIPTSVRLADGRIMQTISHSTNRLVLRLGNWDTLVTFDILDIHNFDVIIGVPWLYEHNPDINWFTGTVLQRLFTQAEQQSMLQDTLKKAIVKNDLETYLNLISLELQDIPLYTLKPKATIPSQYDDFSDVFEKAGADTLPEHRSYDIAIDLVPDAKVPWGPIYSLAEPELKALRTYLDENLEKGFIRPSKSPAGAPMLFVKKKDGSLRLCVDYRALNGITIKNRYPLPLIPELISKLRGATIFSKIDLRGAYNLVRIRPGDEWKTAFRCRFGHYEYKVMPFGLTNAPATFQYMMNDIFRDKLDEFVVVYLDDILIFSKNENEHAEHVRFVLKRLREFKLFAKLEKCEFHCDTTEFLGYVIKKDGIGMDPKKVESILSWPVPKNQRELQVPLGFVNFYRSFIPSFARITVPLTQLLRKDVKFIWSDRSNTSFHSLKESFKSDRIIRHADPSSPFILETDSSDFAISGILSQNFDGILHPVGFFSRKMVPAEINYEIHDKELLAIIASFKEWRALLLGAQHSVKVFTDHKNLLYFASSKTLNRRQARWAMFLVIMTSR